MPDMVNLTTKQVVVDGVPFPRLAWFPEMWKDRDNRDCSNDGESSYSDEFMGFGWFPRMVIKLRSGPGNTWEEPDKAVDPVGEKTVLAYPIIARPVPEVGAFFDAIFVYNLGPTSDLEDYKDALAALV